MKNIVNYLLLLVGLSTLVIACDKADSLSYYDKGNAPELTASTNTITTDPADSNNTVLTLAWTDPNYATDSSSVKYLVQMDSSGRNFTKPHTVEVTGENNVSFTGKEINDILLGFGFEFGVSYNVDVRVVSSYSNNNDQQTSNVVTIAMTPYKVPPAVVLPYTGKLFIVGSATQGGWGNPVPVPSQELSQIDETTYGGVFNLIGGNEYLILPENGSWAHKYAIPDNTVAGGNQSGSFGYDEKDNFPGPAVSGWYTIILNFQTGTYTVTPYSGSVPDQLFMVGDATPGGWGNPVPTPSQQLTRLNSTQYEIVISLNGGGHYLFLPENGSWAHKYGCPDNGIESAKWGGPIVADGPAKDIPAPDESATYKVEVNFLTNTYNVTKQ